MYTYIVSPTRLHLNISRHVCDHRTPKREPLVLWASQTTQELTVSQHGRVITKGNLWNIYGTLNISGSHLWKICQILPSPWCDLPYCWHEREVAMDSHESSCKSVITGGAQ